MEEAVGEVEVVGLMERITGDSWTWSFILILLMISSAIGLVTLTRLLTTFVQWIYVYFLRRPKNLRGYGTWAVVTGATDGIGKAFAIQLAKQGLNMILIGRSTTKLSSVSSEILQSVSRPCRIKKLTLDFSSDEDLATCVDLVRKSTAGLDVGVLVNSAGTTYPHGMYFHEVSEDLWRDIMKVNVVGLTMMVQAVLPGMLERRKGAIINVGSAASVAVPSFPLFAIYAATKTYVDSFSRSLHTEYRNSGIDVQCQIPMYVATKMVPLIKNTTFFVPSPEDYAHAAIRQIGYGSLSAPYWTHSMQWWFASLIPDVILNGSRLKYGISNRRRYWSNKITKSVKGCYN